MREIKFRGKRIDNGEWIYGSLIGSDVIVGEVVEFNDEYFNTEFWCKVVPETVNQYTGIKDIKGKNVYDGDILRRKSPLTGELYFAKVVFDEENARFLAVAMNGLLQGLASTYISRGYERIGTIYDNPELLEETK